MGTRSAVLVACLLVSLCCSHVLAQPAGVRVARAYDVGPNQTVAIDVPCPPNYEYSGVGLQDTGGHGLQNLEYFPRYYDASGQEVFPLSQLNVVVSRVVVSARNKSNDRQTGIVWVFCVPGLALALADTLGVAPGATVKIDALCPPGQVPVGQINNADGTALLQRSRVYIFLSGGDYSFLDDADDGETAAPVGIQLEIANASSTTQTVQVRTLCQSLPGARTFVSSTATAPGQPFSVAGNVPDAYKMYGYTAVGGLYGAFQSFALWGTDGSVSTQAAFASPTGALPATEVRNIFIDGVDRRPQSSAKATARAVMGILAVPVAAPPPAPTIVTVIEFYNQALDHYFITGAAKEISDLDTGVHAGWQRTGQTFKAYGPGSTGRPGRRPVCRAYGNPAAGLDSHFYSASPSECAATLSNFNGAWLYEASEVLQMELPNVVTGACPQGAVPIYRVWNRRADSNHRYVTTLALRDQMVAKGYVAEGYGPNAVTLCASQ